jgi:hypothetical protein
MNPKLTPEWISRTNSINDIRRVCLTLLGSYSNLKLQDEEHQKMIQYFQIDLDNEKKTNKSREIDLNRLQSQKKRK